MSTIVTIPEYFKSMNILHLAFIAGPSMFLLAGAYLNMESGFSLHTDGDVVLFGSVLLAVIAGTITAEIALSKNRLAAIKEMDSMSEKLNHYRALFIIRVALAEGPALFSVILFIITGSAWFALAALPMLLLVVSRKTSKEKLRTELELTIKENMWLNDNSNTVSLG